MARASLKDEFVLIELENSAMALIARMRSPRGRGYAVFFCIPNQDIAAPE
jgi:hypothetical protein